MFAAIFREAFFGTQSLREHTHKVKATVRVEVRTGHERTVEAKSNAQIRGELEAELRHLDEEMEDIRSQRASIQKHLDGMSEGQAGQTSAGSKDNNAAWLLKQAVLW